MEPLGIQDMRFAKAEYIRALKDLRAADAELQRALAAVELANARYRDAETANLNADTEYQKLLNEYQQLINEARQDTNDFIHNATISAIDSLKKEIELRELTHAKAMVDAEKALAQAKEELRVALRNISLAAGDLTGPEKVALAEAVAVYYGLTEEVIKQEYRVFKAQQKVDTLTEYALRFSDTAWNGYALVDMDDYFEDAIEWEEAKIAKWMEDYEAIPDSSARVAEWKAYVDKFVDRENKLDYELAKIDANETAIASLMKEGIKDFNLAVLDFIEENWEKAGTVYTEPAELTTAEKAIIAKGEPKQADYKQKMDTIISFPALYDLNSAVNFNKFSYLLNSYKVTSPVTKTDSLIIKQYGDTLRIVKANQSMKGFILGAAGDGDDAEEYPYIKDGVKKTLYADYGLKGALDVLKRVYEDEKTLDPKETAKVKHVKDSIWAAHNAILAAGLTSFKDYTEAIAAFTEAKKKDSPKALFAAMKDLYDQLADIDGDDDINKTDSVAVLAAVQAFAVAREAYLDDETEYAEGKNPHFFYFAAGESGGEPVVDSVAFTEIATQTKFKPSVYVYKPNEYVSIAKSLEDDAIVATDELTIRATVINVISQLFGADYATIYPVFNTTAPTSIDLLASSGGPLSLDYSQLIIPGADADYQYTVKNPETWEDPKTLDAPVDPYKPAAVVEAEDGIYAAIAKFNDVYNDYWNQSIDNTAADVKTALSGSWAGYFADPKASTLNTALTATYAQYDTKLMDKGALIKKTEGLKMRTYTAADFKPFTLKDAPFVIFDNTTLIPTDALCAVLTAIDPYCTDREDNGFFVDNGVDASAIFNGFDTDFYHMMKAQYDDWAANHPDEDFEQDIQAITNWIAAVETAFENDAAKAGKDDKTAYNTAHNDWEDAVEKKAVWDEYEAALIEFAGTRIDASGDTLINDVYGITSPFDASTITPPYPLTDVKNLFATNILGVYVGWIETLGGEQLANAIKAFGEEPWEQFNEWNAEKAQYNAQKTDLAGLKTKAEAVYKAEAKMEGYDRVASAADFEAAYKAYVQAYKALRDAIVVYDEFGNIDMNNTEAKVNKAMQEIERLSHEAACYKSDVPDWEGLIAEAQKDLKVQEARLQSLKSALEYAKTNYEKLKEYILSQDASYVIPVSVADIQSLLKGLGIDINALIGTYLGNEEEVEPVVEP